MKSSSSPQKVRRNFIKTMMSRIAKRTVAELCDEFVCNDEDKSLEKFLHEKHAELSMLFPKHPFGKLKAKIISIYVYTLQKHKYSKERISQLKLVNELIWDQYFASVSWRYCIIRRLS
jgi:hypothetical protein